MPMRISSWRAARLALGDPFLAAGMGSISVSRPSYLRTSIDVGRTAAEQADAFAALLHTLNIKKVAAQGISGGGPCAIHFAARHPDRVRPYSLSAPYQQPIR